MTPQRAEQFCSLLSFVADILDGMYRVEPAVLERAARILKETPKATTYTPPVSPFVADVRAEVE